MRGYAWPATAIILGGILHTVFLLSQTREDVFYASDARVKSLLVRQFDRGRLTPVLRLSDEAWVRELWDRNLYPLRAPFVYDTPRGRMVGFPLLFPLITTPLYRLFGAIGLRILPALALWALWIRLALVGRRLELDARVGAVTLASVVFASPLTLYGAMFWEHTLGVSLAFAGVEFVTAAVRRRVGITAGAAAGVVAASAVWFRPEAVVLVLAFAALALHPGLHRHGRAGSAAFVGGVGVGLGLLVAANLWLYGRPLGLHAVQVLEHASVLGRLHEALAYLPPLLLGLLTHFPWFAFVGIVLLLPGRAAGKPRPPAGALLFAALAVLLAVPAVVPNAGGKQWGPRYLLVLVPILALLGGLLLRRALRTAGPKLRVAAWGAALAALVLGAYGNGVRGTAHFVEQMRERRDRFPAFMARYECAAFDPRVIPHAYLGSFRNRLFLIYDLEALQALAASVARQGIDRFLLVSPSAGMHASFPGPPGSLVARCRIVPLADARGFSEVVILRAGPREPPR